MYDKTNAKNSKESGWDRVSTELRDLGRRRVSTAHIPTLLDASPVALIQPAASPPPFVRSPHSIVLRPLPLCAHLSAIATNMATTQDLLKEAEASTDPKRAEALYKEILGMPPA